MAGRKRKKPEVVARAKTTKKEKIQERATIKESIQRSLKTIDDEELEKFKKFIADRVVKKF